LRIQTIATLAVAETLLIPVKLHVCWGQTREEREDIQQRQGQESFTMVSDWFLSMWKSKPYNTVVGIDVTLDFGHIT
jgi:hypothetical protein